MSTVSEQDVPTVESENMKMLCEVKEGNELLCGGQYRTVKELDQCNSKPVLIMEDGTHWTGEMTALRHVKGTKEINGQDS